jgi:hypothetical protein
MRLFLTIIAAISSMFMTSCSKNEKMTFTDTQNSEFKVGQVWNYKTRSNETNSTLTICKVETVEKLGTVVHISISDVKIKSPQNKDGEAQVISHLPFAESAVKQSVTQILRVGVAPTNYVEGYQIWRNAVENGKGGVWTVTVAEAINAMESTLNK